MKAITYFCRKHILMTFDHVRANFLSYRSFIFPLSFFASISISKNKLVNAVSKHVAEQILTMNIIIWTIQVTLICSKHVSLLLLNIVKNLRKNMVFGPRHVNHLRTCSIHLRVILKIIGLCVKKSFLMISKKTHHCEKAQVHAFWLAAST